MTRQRSFDKRFDYDGIAAIGDYQYDDGFDKWEEIKEAFKKVEDKIPLKRSHGDIRDVGFIKHWDLDKTNKTLYVGWNKEDMVEDIEFKDDKFKVSIEYETLGEKIIGVNHIAVGNTFKQKCPLKICNITNNMKQRGDEPDTTTDVVIEPDEIEEPVVPEETTESEPDEIALNTVLTKEIELLKKQVEELSKVKAQPEPEPVEEVDEEVETKIKDKKLKLGFKDKLKHEIPTREKPTGEYSWWFDKYKKNTNKRLNING